MLKSYYRAAENGLPNLPIGIGDGIKILMPGDDRNLQQFFHLFWQGVLSMRDAGRAGENRSAPVRETNREVRVFAL